MAEPSLRDIQAAYFDGLEEVFGEAYSQMKKYDANCDDIATDLASRDHIVEAFAHDQEGFFGALIRFWERYQDVVARKLSTMTALKAVYGGDLSDTFSPSRPVRRSRYLVAEEIARCSIRRRDTSVLTLRPDGSFAPPD